METLLNLLKSAAPGLATIVAGPLGGAAVSAIASKLGVSDTVAAVTQALQADPEAAQKLAEIGSSTCWRNSKSSIDIVLGTGKIFQEIRCVCYHDIEYSAVDCIYMFLVLHPRNSPDSAHIDPPRFQPHAVDVDDRRL